MQSFRLYSFHPTTQSGYRVFTQRRNGFCAEDKELHVLGLSVLKIRKGSTTVTEIVPTYLYDGRTYFGKENWDADELDAEVLIVPPGTENVADLVYSHFANILSPEDVMA